MNSSLPVTQFQKLWNQGHVYLFLLAQQLFIEYLLYAKHYS